MRELIGAALLVAVLSGCASAPTRPDGIGRVFPRAPDVIQKAAVNALVVSGFEIEKQEALYVQGFKTRQVGLFVGSGGETVGVWIEPAGPMRTRVYIDTAKSLLGIVGQRNWNEDVMTMLEHELARPQ
jgi:hypothetical protein